MGIIIVFLISDYLMDDYVVQRDYEMWDDSGFTGGKFGQFVVQRPSSEGRRL